MKKPARKWESFLTPQAKEDAIRSIGSRFLDEHDLEIGLIAAEDHLDFLLDTIGKHIYNKALHDARQILREGMERTEIDIESLSH